MSNEDSGGFDFKKVVLDAWEKQAPEPEKEQKPKEPQILDEEEELFVLPEELPSISSTVQPFNDQLKEKKREQEWLKQAEQRELEEAKKQKAAEEKAKKEAEKQKAAEEKQRLREIQVLRKQIKSGNKDLELELKEKKREQEWLKQAEQRELEEAKKQKAAEEKAKKEAKKQKAAEEKQLKATISQIKKEKNQALFGAVKNKFEVATTVEEPEELGEEKREKRQTRIKRAFAWIVTTVTVVTGLVINQWRNKGKQGEVTPTTTDPLGESGSLEDKSANYHQITIGRVGFSASGYNLDIGDPRVFINNDFVEMAAKFGDSFLLPPGYNDDGEVVGDISNAAAKNWAEALKISESEMRENYVRWQNNPQEFRQFLSQHGASPTVIDFLQKADELKAQDTTTPNTWDDRYWKLNQWWQQHSELIDGKVAGAPVEHKHINWNEVVEIFQDSNYASSAKEIANKFDINAQDFLGALAGVDVNSNGQFDIGDQLMAVEGVAAVFPEERLALYAEVAADNINFLTVCAMVGMAMAGKVNRQLQIITYPKIDFNLPVDNLIADLKEIGIKILDYLRENSQEFRDWIEELKSRDNAKKLVRRLKNGLSLSRNPEVQIEAILFDPENKDMKDLILNTGPNWFRLIPENHPEVGNVMIFFGCKSYRDLQELAGQQDRVVNRLYRVLVGSGKKADLRKTENVKALIGLYKRASGFSEVKSQ